MRRAAVAEKCAWAAVWQLQIKPPLCGSQGCDPTLSCPDLRLHLLQHFREPESNPDGFEFHRFVINIFKMRIKIRCGPADETPTSRDSFHPRGGWWVCKARERHGEGNSLFHFLVISPPSFCSSPPQFQPIPPSTQSHAVDNEGFNVVNLIWHRRISTQDLSLTARPSWLGCPLTFSTPTHTLTLTHSCSNPRFATSQYN